MSPLIFIPRTSTKQIKIHSVHCVDTYKVVLYKYWAILCKELQCPRTCQMGGGLKPIPNGHWEATALSTWDQCIGRSMDQISFGDWILECPRMCLLSPPLPIMVNLSSIVVFLVSSTDTGYSRWGPGSGCFILPWRLCFTSCAPCRHPLGHFRASSHNFKGCFQRFPSLTCPLHQIFCRPSMWHKEFHLEIKKL